LLIYTFLTEYLCKADSIRRFEKSAQESDCKRNFVIVFARTLKLVLVTTFFKIRSKLSTCIKTVNKFLS
jgi:hypothetical protein